jgi:glycine cleavage system T protein (aminomethyltransferase)
MGLKRTPFFDIHVSLGAKMVPFGGYEMPVQYSGIIEEHKLVRSKVGVFDVSHMGEFEVRGRDALEFLQRMTTNDVSALVEGKVQYSTMCLEDGGIVDDLLVYHMGDHYLLVVNAANIEGDMRWLHQHLQGDVHLKDRCDEISLLAVQGPQSIALLQKLTTVDLAGIPYYHFVRGRLAGIDMLISRTGYTGELGFELYLPSDPNTAASLWKSIFDAGSNVGVGPAGLGARDTLRMEMGFCLYGQDIDASTHPLEAGLGWLTKLDKGPFIGRDRILKAKQEGLKRKLVGFTIAERAFPRTGYNIYFEGQKRGRVTSGTFSPSLEKGIGLGYVDVGHAKPGSTIDIDIRNRQTPAMVTTLPFLKKA